MRPLLSARLMTLPILIRRLRIDSTAEAQVCEPPKEDLLLLLGRQRTVLPSVGRSLGVALSLVSLVAQSLELAFTGAMQDRLAVHLQDEIMAVCEERIVGVSEMVSVL